MDYNNNSHNINKTKKIAKSKNEEVMHDVTDVDVEVHDKYNAISMTTLTEISHFKINTLKYILFWEWISRD